MPTVLAVSAHPDDDTLFAGGALARWADHGYAVYTLCTTRGEGGEVGEPPVGPIEQLGQIREREARCAAQTLGEQEIFFLDFVDPRMEINGTPLPIDATLEQFAEEIAAYLERLRPAIVLTHGRDGEYGHPQHRFTHLATRAAIQLLDGWRPSELLTWMAATPHNREERLMNGSDPATLTLDVEPWFERKLAAAGCHRSQHAMFLRNSKRPTLREVVRRVEHLRSWPAAAYLEPVTWTPPTRASANSDWHR